jgi:sulfide:quinone oxidoreductase
VVGDSGSFPGPEWMPKQAHMADLQAAAAAENLLAGLRGQTPSATFKVELICIIDAIDRGTLVFRNPRRQIVLPSSRLFHWAKRFFEGLYLTVMTRGDTPNQESHDRRPLPPTLLPQGEKGVS